MESADQISAQNVMTGRAPWARARQRKVLSSLISLYKDCMQCPFWAPIHAVSHVFSQVIWSVIFVAIAILLCSNVETISSFWSMLIIYNAFHFWGTHCIFPVRPSSPSISLRNPSTSWVGGLQLDRFVKKWWLIFSPFEVNCMSCIHNVEINKYYDTSVCHSVYRSIWILGVRNFEVVLCISESAALALSILGWLKLWF